MSVVLIFVSLITGEINYFHLFMQNWTLYFIFYKLHIHVFCPFSYCNFLFTLLHFNHLSAIYAVFTFLIYI